MDCVTENILKGIAEKQADGKDKQFLLKLGEILRELNMFEYRESQKIVQMTRLYTK